MQRPVRGALAPLFLLLALGTARAQDAADPFALPRDLPVALVADEIVYDSVAERLTARGSVQVFYGERTLTADLIVYDRRADRIEAEGRLVLRNPDGTTLFATYAELDPQLRDGLLRSAQAVIAQRARLAAVEARRVGGRYTVLEKTVFSTCTVCPAAPVPLWQIRARRVIHDEAERMIHYEDATFDVAGVPVFHLPYFRHPDPSVERATGFLVPEYLSSDTIGQALKIPFHIVIDDQTDATVTPFLTTEAGIVLEGEIRRRFAAGYAEFQGSITAERDRRDRPFRGNLTGTGWYHVTDDIFGRYDLAIVSDDGYLTDFEYSDADRLTSEIALASYRRDGFWELGAVYFQSLRAGEGVGSIPMVLPEFDLSEVWQDGLLGGTLGLALNGVGLRRTGGQDMVRAGALLDWERTCTTRQGLLLSAQGEVRYDVFRVWDSPDPATLPNGLSTRFTPLVGIGARYPFVRADPGATHVIEPIVEMLWSEPVGDQALLPNEDSLLVEFDETNLFDTSRFAGYDRVEPGFRVNAGLRYERIDADGWRVGGLVGRVFRAEAEPVFAGVAGLSGTESDYVAALTFAMPPNLSLVSRVLLTDDFRLDRNELRLDLAFDTWSLAGSYVFLSEDLLGGALTAREEASLEGRYRLSRTWSVGAAMTYDLAEGQFVRAGGEIGWANDCVEVDFSVSRRFTSTNRVNASTSFGLQVRLAGLGTDAASRDARERCGPDLGL